MSAPYFERYMHYSATIFCHFSFRFSNVHLYIMHFAVKYVKTYLSNIAHLKIRKVNARVKFDRLNYSHIQYKLFFSPCANDETYFNQSTIFTKFYWSIFARGFLNIFCTAVKIPHIELQLSNAKLSENI